MNITEIAGRLGSDPEVRFTPNGQKVTTFRVATNQRKAGKDETIWWRVTVWGERFDKMMTYLKKGSAVIVVGELAKPEIYQNREGQPQVSLEITAEMIRFSPFGKSSNEQHSGDNFEQGASSTPSDQVVQGQGGESSGKEEGIFSEDEIPF
ncbi:MAG: single-stranded DNA-binding protein [Chlamydiales bacterium]|nr:single-stranded DNA-binding protein [Chlamydiales bacterium]NCF71253.1 single-stranded DNA-binding protein [Chlamydiales bacterium]